MADSGRSRTHVCKACGLEQPWAARCAGCKSFGLSMRGIAEIAALGERTTSALSGVLPDRPPAALTSALAITEAAGAVSTAVVPAVDAPGSSVPISLVDFAEQTYVRDSTGLAPLDDVLGGGMVVGSVVVVFGEPGAGKSSLVAQALSNSNLRVLYATGEETVAQVAGRARRINAASKRVYVVAETDLDVVLHHARAVRAQVICIDSIQTLVCEDLAGGAGSPGQIKECTNRLVKYAKSTDVSAWIIGHVTNDGTLAGPKTLKHLVDVALELENGPGDEKILRCAGKNRFGPTNVVGRFEMTAEGLEPISVRSGPNEDEPGPEGFH